MSLPDRRAQLTGLAAERAAVLDRSGLDPATAERYLATLPARRFASHAYRNRPARPYLQPRGGYPALAKQHLLTQALAEAGADFIPLTIDSHTRHNDYRSAAHLLALGLEQDRDLLNGYPLISHGHLATRQLYEQVDRPVSLRHGTPDARLLVELALAAGITEIEGGGLSYTLPYSDRYPLDRALGNWQYVDRLCAIAGPAGLPIHRESFGPLTATLVPPVITIVVQLCELLLASEQGVTSFAVSFGQTGSLEQDLAIARVLRASGRELLNRFGFADVELRLVYHQWMGAFPDEPALAWQLIAVSALISQLAGADKVVLKTPDEATGLPTVAGNVAAVRAVRYLLDRFGQSDGLTSEIIDEEADLLASEVDHVLDHLLAHPAPTFLQSVYRSVLAGAIDVPFSPHRDNRSALVSDRAPGRQIRILDPGAVPISAEDQRREQKLLGSRIPDEGPLWQRLLRDIRLLA
ncbi:MAG: methylaspartate mutase [Jatrophihabitantaceae bacterium]